MSGFISKLLFFVLFHAVLVQPKKKASKGAAWEVLKAKNPKLFTPYLHVTVCGVSGVADKGSHVLTPKNHGPISRHQPLSSATEQRPQLLPPLGTFSVG